jgi:hypothetical protein
VSGGIFDDIACTLYRPVEIVGLFCALVVFPVCTLGENSKSDFFIGKAFADKGKGIGEVGLGFISPVIVVPAKTTHPTPSGG